MAGCFFRFDPKTFTEQRWSKPHEAVVYMSPKNYWGNLQWKVKDSAIGGIKQVETAQQLVGVL